MSNAREKLAQRIQEICDELKFDKAKRQTLLAKKYKVSITTGRNWVLGLKVPDYDSAIQMCEDANVNYEWLMSGAGLKYRSNPEKCVVVTDPDLIKLVQMAEPLQKAGRIMAIKGVDAVCQFVAQTEAEYHLEKK